MDEKAESFVKESEKDAIASFTPDSGWTAHFRAAEGPREMPVIGWALDSAGILRPVVLFNEKYPTLPFFLERLGITLIRLSRDDR